MSNDFKKYLTAKQKADLKYKNDMLKLAVLFEINRDRKMYKEERIKIEKKYDNTIEKLKKKYNVKKIALSSFLKQLNITTWLGDDYDNN